LKEFIYFFPGGSEFWALLESEMNNLSSLNTSDTLHLGRLSVKEEAAGKARVFAITDSITQSVMEPLHKFIFDLLKNLPMDGTFDQGAPLKRLLDLHRNGDLSNQTFYSYDLSSATDRLPITLQKEILSLFFGEQFSILWAKILIGRD